MKDGAAVGERPARSGAEVATMLPVSSPSGQFEIQPRDFGRELNGRRELRDGFGRYL